MRGFEVPHERELTAFAETLLFATGGHEVTPRYRDWRRILVTAVWRQLGPEYEIVEHHSLVGVSLPRTRFAAVTDDALQLYSCLFAKRSIRVRMRDLAVSVVKTGFKNEYGNKVRLFRSVSPTPLTRERRDPYTSAS